MTSAFRAVLIGVAVSLPTAWAVDFPLVEETATGLTGAIEGVLGEDTSTQQYLPGYGFHYTLRFEFDPEGDPDALIDRLQDVLVRLAPTVDGLEEGDWISVWAYGYPGITWGEAPDRFTVLARIQWDNLDNFEVWKDNERIL